MKALTDTHYALLTLIMCTTILTWKAVELLRWEGSFNGLDFLLVVTISIIGSKTYTHIAALGDRNPNT
jgi:hypothetical protein